MILGRVAGTVVATRKDERLTGKKLLIVRLVDEQGDETGEYLVAVDSVQAGSQEMVVIVQGSSARMASGLKDTPVDAAIIGIVDTVALDPPGGGRA